MQEVHTVAMYACASACHTVDVRRRRVKAEVHVCMYFLKNQRNRCESESASDAQAAGAGVEGLVHLCSSPVHVSDRGFSAAARRTSYCTASVRTMSTAAPGVKKLSAMASAPSSTSSRISSKTKFQKPWVLD